MTKKTTTEKKTTRKRTAAKGRTIVPVILNRGQYRIVGSDANNIMPSSTETRTEDQILNPTSRARLLDITRNLVRNSSLFNTILGQMTTNVIGSEGGKVVLSIPNAETNKELKRQFFRWTRNADFATTDTLNHLLKRVLREYVIGGDCVLLFDDGLVENSGKVIVFESNEIVDVAPEEVEKRYGKGAWASQGKVYSANGRHIGTIVSRSQANICGYADPSKCYFLKKDPNAYPLDNYWWHFSNNWREGRGVTPASSAIATIHQLEDLVSSELLSSRLSSQLFCWLVNTGKNAEIPMPSPFDSDQDFQGMTDDEVKKAYEEAAKEEEKVVDLKHARESSVAFQQLPDGFEAQQVQTLHPNTNVQTIVDFLANRCAATLGLSKVFATGNPTDSDYRANQLFSWPAIKEFQKSIEQICDWVFYKFVKWGQKTGLVKAYVAEDFMDYCDWEWRGIDDLDEVAHQNAIRLALENNTLSYREILGNDWQERLTQTAIEHQWFAKMGITHPAEKLLSGGETVASKKSSETTTTEETEETTPTIEETK